MEIHYCSKCRARVSSFDMKEGRGIEYEGNVYCNECVRKYDIGNPDKFYVKGRDEKVYTFVDLSKFKILIERKLVDPDCQARTSPEADWQPLRNIPRLAEMLKKDQTHRESPSLMRARKRSSGGEERLRHRTSPSEQPSQECKPGVMNIIPAVLSCIPGLGQMYNVTPGRAYMFGSLFIAAVGLYIFKPAVGIYALIPVVFLSMCDAYGEAAGRGFWHGTGRGLICALKIFCTATAIVIWIMAVIICIDALACWIGSGTPLISAIDFTGKGGVPKDWNPLWVSVISLGACVLLFGIHGSGRKFIWARKSLRHFSHTARILLLAAVIAGVFTVSVYHYNSTKPFFLLHIPLKTVTFVFHAPAVIVNSLGASWNYSEPGFLTKMTSLISDFSKQADTSLSAHATLFNIIMLASIITLLPFLFKSMMSYAGTIPGLADIAKIWKEDAHERKEILRHEWEEMRKAFDESRKRKEELKKVQHKQSMEMMNVTNIRLDRLDGLVRQLALLQSGAQMTEEQRASMEEALQKKPEPLPEPVPYGFFNKIGYCLKRFWLFIQLRAWPLPVKFCGICFRSAAKGVRATGRWIKTFSAGRLGPGLAKAGKGVISLPGKILKRNGAAEETEKKLAQEDTDGSEENPPGDNNTGEDGEG